MNKCQHGERISFFCATQNCQSKQSSGCEQCLRRHHNHLSGILHLPQQQIVALIRKFTVESTVKPKCRLLQESIYNYFNQLKAELTNSLDLACKNIINQIGYPFLYSTNTLSTYKRLKNKEYRKVSQKEFRAFYENALRIQDKQLAREENRIYLQQVRNAQEFFAVLEAMIKHYEAGVKNFHNSFAHEGVFYFKIMEIIKSIGNESPDKKAAKKSAEIKEQSQSKAFQGYIPIPRLDLKIQEHKAIEQKSKTDRPQQMELNIISPQTLAPPKVLKTRDVSLDKKIIKQHRFNPNEYGSNAEEKTENRRSESGLPNQKIQNLKQELNHKQMQINQKKKLLLEIMKQTDKEKSDKLQKYQSVQISPVKNRIALPTPIQQNINKKQLTTSETKSINQNESKSSKSSQELSGLEEQPSKMLDTKNYAFTKLPIAEDALPKKSIERSEVRKKLIVVPAELNLKGISNINKIQQIDSPLYKKRRIQASFEQSKDQKQEEKSELQPKRIESDPKNPKQVLQIKQNEQKSLALLLKSLKLGAEQAIAYLQSSLKYADNNLSAAQYLSYLYLELNRPKECLNLCNRFLDRIEYSAESDDLMININNNKAAALNLLGRSSEAILLLEHCLKLKEKDTMLKSIGDSYFSLGKLDKAIQSYQKSLKLNPNNDETHYNLAACCFIQQNYHQARFSIRKALQFQPKNEHYLQLDVHIEARTKSH